MQVLNFNFNRPAAIFLQIDTTQDLGDGGSASVLLLQCFRMTLGSQDFRLDLAEGHAWPVIRIQREVLPCTLNALRSHCSATCRSAEGHGNMSTLLSKVKAAKDAHSTISPTHLLTSASRTASFFPRHAWPTLLLQLSAQLLPRISFCFCLIQEAAMQRQILISLPACIARGAASCGHCAAARSTFQLVNRCNI